MPTSPDTDAADAGGGRLPPGQNFGAMNRRLDSGDLVLNTAFHAPGMQVPLHEHDNAYLCIVLEGGFELLAPRGIDCGPGSVIAHPAGHRHANRFSDQPGRCLNIHVGGAWLADRSLSQWLADFHRVGLPPGVSSLRRLSRELLAGDEAAPLAAASAAVELLAEAMRLDHPRAQPAWLRRVVERIEDDLSRVPALAELAAEAGTHPAHLSRVFRSTLGETVGDYVRRRRVEQAEQALAGPLSLAEIAAAWGFADQSHFTRLFRARFGVSPGERRRAMQASF